MSEIEKKVVAGFAKDSLTTAHLQESLTTAHLQQQLQQPAQPTIVASQVSQSSPTPPASTGKK